jgi:hypothetical protein
MGELKEDWKIRLIAFLYGAAFSSYIAIFIYVFTR